MQFKKPEWDRFDSMKLRLIVHHFNEELQRYRPLAPPKKPLTWAQAYAKIFRSLPLGPVTEYSVEQRSRR